MTFALQALVKYAKEETGNEHPNEIPPQELIRLPVSMLSFRLTSIRIISNRKWGHASSTTR